MAWRPAHAPPAEARPSGRDGRRPARCGGGRRSARPDRRRRRGGRRGRPRAGSAHRARVRRSCRDRSRGGGACQGQRGAQRASVAHARPAARRLNPRERREAGLAESAGCVVTNPPFFDANAVRASPDEGKARAHVLAGGEAGATLADWIQASLAMLAPGGRLVMIHRPEALGADPRRDWRPARRARASAGSSDHRRERASPAGLGREGLQGAAAPRAWAGPARARRPTDGGGGRLHRGERLIDWGA